MKIALLSFWFAIPALAAFAADPAALPINEFGLDLHRRLSAEQPKVNFCTSPYSIQHALAMISAGAGGATKTQMAQALHYPAGDGMAEALANLRQSLTELAEKTAAKARRAEEFGQSIDPVVLSVANRLFGRQDFPFHEPFLKQLETHFQAPIERLDFAQPEVATQSINRWVDQQTKHRIQKLIPEGLLTRTTSLVVANAVYLKARWEYSFHQSNTKPEPFFVFGGASKPIPTMNTAAHFGYEKKDGYAAITLPYVTGHLQFLVLIPEGRDGLAHLESRLTGAELAECSHLPSRLISLHLPKLKLAGSGLSLGKLFVSMGMTDAFDPNKADFSGISARPTAISEIVHQSFLEVDESGTEAAAATGAALSYQGINLDPPPKPLEVKVDHPFLFAIQHVASGACLFLGRVVDPR